MFYKLQNNRKNFIVNKKKEKLYDDCITELNFYTPSEQTSFLEKVLLEQGYTPKKQKNTLLLKDKNALLILRFGFDQVNKADVVRAYNEISESQTAYLISESFKTEITEFAERFGRKIVLVNGKELFNYLSNKNCLPPQKYSLLTTRSKRTRLLELFQKTHAKRFFSFGLILLFTSYFSPIKGYYVAFGCVFLIFSLILKMFGKEKLQK